MPSLPCLILLTLYIVALAVMVNVGMEFMWRHLEKRDRE